MAYENFIPTVWNEAIQRELEGTYVFVEDCNRQFEGDVKKQGDSVRILGVGKPTIRTLARSSASAESDFFTRDQVRKMSKQDIHQNYEKIRASMAKW